MSQGSVGQPGVPYAAVPYTIFPQRVQGFAESALHFERGYRYECFYIRLA